MPQWGFMLSHFLLKDKLVYLFLLSSEAQSQPAETVEVVATEGAEEDKPSSPVAQSPPAEESAGPSIPASKEVKSRLDTLNFFLETGCGCSCVHICMCLLGLYPTQNKDSTIASVFTSLFFFFRLSVFIF